MFENNQFRGMKLKDLSDEDAERVLVEAGFPPGNAKIAKAGWSGETPVTPAALAQLLANAEGEASSQK
jgi:hypothetical protein